MGNWMISRTSWRNNLVRDSMVMVCKYKINLLREELYGESSLDRQRDFLSCSDQLRAWVRVVYQRLGLRAYC